MADSSTIVEIEPLPTSGPVDVSLLLVRDYLSANEGVSEEGKQLLAGFLAHARKYLKEHPPLNQFFAGRGIGLTLQGGIDIVFDVDATEAGAGRSSVSVTREKEQPGRRGLEGGSAYPLPVTRQDR